MFFDVSPLKESELLCGPGNHNSQSECVHNFCIRPTETKHPAETKAIFQKKSFLLSERAERTRTAPVY